MIVECPSCATKNKIPDTPDLKKVYRCGKCKTVLSNIPIGSEQGEPPVIGKDIPWKTIEDVALRIKHFLPLATIEGDKVKAFSRTMPYASLLVESSYLPQESYLFVFHKVDFRNLWECFLERGVNSEEEVIVGYCPFPRKRLGKLFSTILPKLHIAIYPRGRLEEIEDPNFRPDDPITWFRPIAEWKSEH